MAIQKESLRVLVISKAKQMTDLLVDTLPRSQYNPIVTATSVGEAKRMLITNSFDLLIINTPLEDDFGIQAALEAASNPSLGILLLVKADLFDQVVYKVEEHGIVTLPKPTSKQMLYSTIKMLSAVHFKIKAMEKETLNLKEKMDDIRIITRAKWILVEQLKMSEPQAHHHIEKQAMDRCTKKVTIAENIIRTYER